MFDLNLDHGCKRRGRAYEYVCIRKVEEQENPGFDFISSLDYNNTITSNYFLL